MLPGVDSAGAAEISYVYDELGRLKAVIDPAADTAVYSYDAVGNLLSISRQSSSVVSIIEFTPNQGPIGTTVTIYGTGFSTTPSQNNVTFNGVSASVTSSTETQIVTTVPATATTGLIGVTTPNGSAASTQAFIVTTDNGPPTITSFTPTIGTPGTAVSINGTNFETAPSKNAVRFNISSAPISSATSTTIQSSVPSKTGSGRITVGTPRGTATSSDDFFIPPSPYTASDVAYTGRMGIGGPSHIATINAANKIGLIVFDGLVGQKVDLGINTTTLSGNSDLTVYSPFGFVVASSTTLSTGTNFHMTLPATGTYTIMVDPDGTSTGNLTLSLSIEVAGVILVDGPSVTATSTAVGQRVRLTFSGTAGQFVSLGVDSLTSLTNPDLYVYSPTGTEVTHHFTTSAGVNFHMTLPATGTYAIILDPDGTQTGSITLTLSSEINAGTVTINGSSVPLAISRVGQRARITSDASSGQQVTVRITGNTMGSVSVSLLKPDGSQQTASTSGASNFNLATQTLSVTGTYSILVDPSSTNTGSMNVSVTNP
jgi:YD repeat-containing protein